MLECFSVSSVLFLFYRKKPSDNEYIKCAYNSAFNKGFIYVGLY